MGICFIYKHIYREVALADSIFIVEWTSGLGGGLHFQSTSHFGRRSLPLPRPPCLMQFWIIESENKLRELMHSAEMEHVINCMFNKLLCTLWS